jgi:hypothetical protein
MEGGAVSGLSKGKPHFIDVSVCEGIKKKPVNASRWKRGKERGK